MGLLLFSGMSRGYLEMSLAEGRIRRSGAFGVGGGGAADLSRTV